MRLTGYILMLALAIVLTPASSAIAQSGRVQSTPTPTPQDETLKIHTEEIKLNVLAFDENGNFFRDVTPNDLVITENNVLHQPSSVRRIPANVVIVMDTGGELRMVKSLKNSQKVAAAVVSSLRPGDSVCIVDYADKAEVAQEWTADKDQMLAGIRRAHFGRRSAFVDALKLSRRLLMRDGIENKHLVLITDGTDSMVKSSDKFDAMQALLATDISVHVISYSQLEADAVDPKAKTASNAATPLPNALPPEVQAQLPNGVRNPTAVKIGPTINMDRTYIRTMKNRKLDLEVSQHQLDRLAQDSNGEFILPITVEEMVEKAPLVAKMIDASYLVTYMPKIPVVETRGIAERSIQVTSKRNGLIVEARRKLLIASKR